MVKVNRNNLQGRSWEVKVGEKTLMCTYGDNIIYLPDCTRNGSYYIPKKECKVEVSIDKKTKINTITRIKDPNKQPISMIDNTIKLQGNGTASVVVGEDTTTFSGDVVIDTTAHDDLPDEISITDLYKKVKFIESKLSDDNVI